MSLASYLFGPDGAAARGSSPSDAPHGSILIGSRRTIRYMRTLLRSAGRRETIHGCLTLRPRRRRSVASLRVLGTVGDLDVAVRIHRVRTAYVCIPLSMHTLAARVTARLHELGVEVRRVVTIADQLDGRLGGAAMSLDFAALLDRKPRPLDEDAIRHVLTGKRALITGAGGSIGSDLARICARFQPQSIGLMERAENNLFEIDRWLGARYPMLDRRAILHDVTDAARTRSIVADFAPHVVFHAAAHKHVPMMEDHPREAVINNFFGTKAIADASVNAGAERFVMISTDKAVNPTSVMGATKRTAELYVQDLDQRSDTLCSMVRFGNVLGSACSVVPIWQQQLSEGGPLTVTDKRMTRFFMTIPEAAALVIQAASLDALGGCIFVLDMGEPVRIVDMAERFIRAHGLEPRRDIDVVFTGARPGEKLYEELAYDTEDVDATAHPSVRLLRMARPGAAHVAWMLQRFGELAHCDERGPIVAALRRAVPEMLVPPDELTDDVDAPLEPTIARVGSPAPPVSKSA